MKTRAWPAESGRCERFSTASNVAGLPGCTSTLACSRVSLLRLVKFSRLTGIGFLLSLAGLARVAAVVDDQVELLVESGDDDFEIFGRGFDDQAVAGVRALDFGVAGE